MQQPETQQNQQTTEQTTTPDVLDPKVQYVRRKRAALWVTVSLLALALLVLTVGLISATRTTNVPVAGYYSGIVLSFGAFLGIVGLHLLENRRPMLIASIIFISIGVIASFFCAIVDGIIASEFIDIRPVQEDICDFYGSKAGYAYDNYYTEVTCRSSNKACKLKVRSNTCYCCYLYNCESFDYDTHYYAFTGVSKCWDVVHLYRLLWASVMLNVMALFLGIITAALLGAYKDLQKPTPQIASSPPPQPHILYNPNHHIPTYANFCPPGQALPIYPNYPIPMQHDGSFQPPPMPQLIPEGGCVPNPHPSEETQSQQPPQAPTQPQPQGGTQEPAGYMLTPNAPVLYSSFGPFEKPPPYAC